MRTVSSRATAAEFTPPEETVTTRHARSSGYLALTSSYYAGEEWMMSKLLRDERKKALSALS